MLQYHHCAGWHHGFRHLEPHGTLTDGLGALVVHFLTRSVVSMSEYFTVTLSYALFNYDNWLRISSPKGFDPISVILFIRTEYNLGSGTVHESRIPFAEYAGLIVWQELLRTLT